MGFLTNSIFFGQNVTRIRNSSVKKLLQTISRAANPSWCPIISPFVSSRIPGKVETQNAAIDRLIKKQERYDTTCERKWKANDCVACENSRFALPFWHRRTVKKGSNQKGHMIAYFTRRGLTRGVFCHWNWNYCFNSYFRVPYPPHGKWFILLSLLRKPIDIFSFPMKVRNLNATVL